MLPTTPPTMGPTWEDELVEPEDVDEDESGLELRVAVEADVDEALGVL